MIFSVPRSTTQKIVTNIVVFAIDNKLNERERNAMQDEEWAISPIVLWELAMLAEARKIKLDLDGVPFRGFLAEVDFLPINLNVARTSTRMDFQSDPADLLIAATSIVYGIPLVTRDRRIRNSKMVPLAI